MRAVRIVLTLAVMLRLVGGLARAQDYGPGTLFNWSYGRSSGGGPNLYGPIVTDRPYFNDSPVTVGNGVVQLETGYTYTHEDDGEGSIRSHSFPESLLRLGTLAEWFEFRLDWNFLEERSNEFGGPNDTVSGAEDLGLGIKLALTPQECMLPETALILQMSVPTGSSELTADEVLPGFNFLYGWDINEEWSTGGSTALNDAIDDQTRDSYVEFAQSWTVGRSWTERVGSYAEWFVLAPSSADTNRTEHYFNGGFTVLLSNDVQWDVRAGLGLNGPADDFFTGTGLSARYW